MGIKIALAGNPNCGKTTLFNNLTGSRQYVGNWPGVTVEKKDGFLRSDKEIVIQDLPGIYSLSPYTLEEVVTRQYLVNEKPDVIINIVDATNLERNLYLTTQLLELNLPVVIALNMMDVVEKSGDVIDIPKLKKELGCDVVPISALKKTGIDELVEAAKAAAAKGAAKEAPHVFQGATEHAIAHIEESIQGMVDPQNIRWYAIKIFERDEKVIEELSIPEDVMAHIEEHIVDCEKEMDDVSESIIIAQRYEYIAKIIPGILSKVNTGTESVSDKIDKIVTNRFLALPIFAVVIFIVYYISVTWLGGIVTDWTNDVLFGEIIGGNVQAWLEGIGASELVVSLVVDGIIGGIGAPIGFAPQMALVFFLLGILEDVGYMSRVAFIMDRIFRRFGLSGKSFIPFLISTGCGLPGIMATRTIENEKDRRMTMIVTTYMPCGAKLPVIATIAGYVCGGLWWVAPSIYLLAIAVIIMACIILKKFKMFAGEPAPFVMELPPYHVPSLRNVLLHTWERIWAFLKKAGTILFACCVVMWFLATFGFGENGFGMVETEESLLASIGGAISFLFVPLGFGTWQAVASSLSGFVAKEGIVATMGVLAGLGEIEAYDASFQSAFAAFFPTYMSAISFMIFNLFNSPCLAAISTLAKEMQNRSYFWQALLFQNLSSYCLTLVIYQFGGLIVGQVSFSIWTVVAGIVLLGILYLLFRKNKYADLPEGAEALTA